MFGLPTDVLKVIKEFSGPIMTRADWRTCKRNEAELVESHNGLVTESVDDIDFLVEWNSEEIHEWEGWTLFGKRWMIRQKKWRIIYQGQHRCPPTDRMYENPRDWYKHQIQWLNQS